MYGDDRNGEGDIYCFNLVTGVEKRLTTNTHGQWAPAIYGNRSSTQMTATKRGRSTRSI